MLIIPMKESSGINVDDEVKRLVDKFYDGNQDVALMEFTNLRQKTKQIANNAIKEERIVDKQSLDVLYKYYDQLCALEVKSTPAEFKNLKDEKIWALFNIGAFCSALADSQDYLTEFGFQFANQLLEQSAGIFACLSPLACVDAVPDLDVNALQALSAIALAQAQELFVLKAIEEFSKPSYIAMLAYACKELFAQAKNHLENSRLANQDTNLVRKVMGKEAELYATAEYHQSIVCCGTIEETVRLHHATDLFGTAETKLSDSKLYKRLGSEIYIKLADLHSLQPELDVSLFDKPNQKQMVKMIPFERKRSSSFNDLFDTKLSEPMNYPHVTANVACVNGIFDVELKKLRATLGDGNGQPAKNSSDGLKNGISENGPSQRDYQSILQKANYIRDQGGVESLRRKMDESTKILNEIKEIWINCDYLLNEENKDDTRLREQFRGKWTLDPFDESCETLRARAGTYREFIRKAKLADKIARNTFDKHATAMEQLVAEQSAASIGFFAAINSRSTEREEEKNVDINADPDTEHELSQCESTEKTVNNADDIASDNEVKNHLDEAYDCYKTLNTDMNCANIFYNDLTQLMDDFHKQVSDLCSARKAEKDGLLWKLAGQIDFSI